jgi:hypothetical protein
MQVSAGATIAGFAGRTPALAQDATPVTEPERGINPVVPFPAPGTRTCSPGTQIVFRGLPFAEIGPVVVTGTESGEHSGIWIAHADGSGGSLIRDRDFVPGESVSVRTRMDIRDVDEGDYEFEVSVPRFERLDPNPNDREVEGSVHEFRSRPGLRPQKVTTSGVVDGVDAGLIFMAPKNGAGRDGALILRQDAEPVWFLPVDVPENRIYEFRAQTWKGEPVLTFWEGISAGGHGYGHYIIMNNRYEVVREFQAGNGYYGGDPHEFIITPQGTALLIIYSIIEWDLSLVGGPEDGFAVDNIVQELDIETGAVLFEWHCLDHIPLTDGQGEYDPEEDDDLDYFHLNSVNVDLDGSILVSGRNSWSCHLLHRVTGDVIWTLGGKSNDFAGPDNLATAWQHDFQGHPGNIYTIYDNGAAPEVHEQSRGMRVALDVDGMTAEIQDEYVHPDGLLSRSQGNMQVLPNGNVFIGWGNEPYASEFLDDGTWLQDWVLPEGKESYRSYKFPWVGRPAESPRLAILRDEADALNAYLSWNGDTETVSWRLFAGAAQDAMDVRATVDRTGFETVTPVSANDLYFAAEALDANGGVIGTSNVVAIAD